MPYLQLTPVLAVVIGVIVWGDRPGWRLLVGGFLVIASILLITLRARARVGKAEIAALGRLRRRSK
jgi:O-acetylserine/cysteine efflux transporter